MLAPSIFRVVGGEQRTAGLASKKMRDWLLAKQQLKTQGTRRARRRRGARRRVVSKDAL
jgi:hypothetical protein